MNDLLPAAGGRLAVCRAEAPLRLAAPHAGWVLVEGGRGTLAVGTESVEVDGRDDVFAAPGWSAVVAQGDEVAIGGTLRASIVWRPGASVATRLIPPGAVQVEERGEGPTARVVRTYVPEGPIIAGETLNPPGGWSSYPPHRHEHEEVYLYRFDPPAGFGVQVRYDDGTGEDASVVRDGHVERIASGYHPVVAAPHATMYYLWALAGDSDRLDPEFDPRYA